MTWILLAIAASFGAPVEGRIELSLSPGARTVIFPRSDPDKVEIGIYRNRVPIDIPSFGTQWLANTKVTSVGGGTWFLELQVRRPEIDARLEGDDQNRVVVLAPGNPDLVRAGKTATSAELLSGTMPRRIDASPGAALQPLSGDASLVTLDPSIYPLPLYAPSIPNLPQPYREWLTTDTSADWDDIARYRKAIPDCVPNWRTSTTRKCTAEEELRLTTASVRLGLTHMDLGFAREASYYLDEAAHGQKFNTPAIHLARARAAYGTRRWNEGRERCAAVKESGGDEALVLECLGVASLATANPPPTETARALLAKSKRPQARLLAAELLQKDNRHSEALPVLREVVDVLEPSWRRRAAAALGDAAAATGNMKAASFFWSRVDAHGDLGEVIDLRVEMGEMLKSGPRWWPSRIPRLIAAARQSTPVAIEARYLLAQVAESYGDPEQASEYLVMLIDRNRALALRSDVPERLVRVCSPRLADLHSQGRHVETVALFRMCWRPILDEVISDTSALEAVRASMEEIGMFEHALDLQQRIAGIQSRENRDTVESLAALLRLYAIHGKGREALETLAYTRKKLGAQVSGPQFAMLEGMAKQAADDVPGAISAYRRANVPGDLGFEAKLRTALLQADNKQCPAAIPTLKASIAEFDRANLPRKAGAKEVPPVKLPADLEPDLVRLTLAHCYEATGNTESAIAVAITLAENTKSKPIKQKAKDFATLVGFRRGNAAPPQGHRS